MVALGRSSRFAVLLVCLVSLIGCVQINIQRTTAPAEQTITPARPAEEKVALQPQPTAAPRRVGRSQTSTSPRALFRYRMPPPVALSVPRLGIDVPVQEVASRIDEQGWYWPIPPESAAHLVGTAHPGEPGNIAITGHVDTEHGAGVFWRLLDIQPGDEVTVWSAAGSFRYKVIEVRVVPETDRSVLQQTSQELLTLLTCIPDGRYTQRLVVRAEPLTPALAQR